MSLISTKNLTIATPSRTICRDLTLTIFPGEIWGILGPNGAGKTTFLHTLAHLFPAKSGEIWLKNSPIQQLSRKKIAQKIGLLFQSTNDFFPQTVEEFCLTGRFPHQSFFKKNSPQDAKMVTKFLQLMGLISLKNRLMHTLSGGERRRLAIAALLTQSPDIYLLDEPTNHLDVAHQMQTLNYFRSLAIHQHKAIMLALHDVNLAQQFCHKILLLFSDGYFLHGLTQEILTENNLSRLYQHPFRTISHENRIFWQAI